MFVHRLMTNKTDYPTNVTVSDLKTLIESALADGKAHDVVTIDLSGKTDFADYMIIASGTSDRHTTALAYNLVQKIKSSSLSHISVEGINDGSWVLVDAGDIVVHIFKPETRELYNLEDMWSAPMFNKKLAIVTA